MDKSFFSNSSFDIPIYENNNFKVVPSLGSLVKGWFLIVPKKEYLSFRDMPLAELNEIEGIKRKIIDTLEYEPNDFIYFEHGPNKKNLKVGCSVDYAHLHMVSLKINIQDYLSKVEPNSNLWEWHKIENLSDIAKINQKKPYLYYKDNASYSCVCFEEDFPSQLFRKVIALYLDRYNEYNWREYPFLDKVEETYNLFNYDQRI